MKQTPEELDNLIESVKRSSVVCDNINREMKTCSSCLWFETFKPRPDEKYNMGCTQPNWAGYVADPTKSDCSGTAWAPTNFKEKQNEK